MGRCCCTVKAGLKICINNCRENLVSRFALLKMGLFSKLGKITLMTLTIVSGILLYFHKECQKEAEENERTRYNDVYKPEKTDWTGELLFRKADSMGPFEINLGPTFAMTQWTPCCILKFIKWSEKLLYGEEFEDMVEAYHNMVNITIMDARKHKPGSFEETGFTLITLDKEPETKNWRARSEDLHIFHTEMEKYFIKMYPQTKRFLWSTNLVRGDTKFMDQPPSVSPHLDFYQGDEEREKFHQVYPPPSFDPKNKTENHILLGEWDTENEKLGVILGVWKPLYPNPICDKPLAVMDASSFKKEDQRASETHVNFLFFTYHALAGGIAHNPAQKWYYFSHQKTTEVLVFHQYSKGKWWSNPHSSFQNKNCPVGTETRISAELRVALFF